MSGLDRFAIDETGVLTLSKSSILHPEAASENGTLRMRSIDINQFYF
jgi:hypothetical protein